MSTSAQLPPRRGPGRPRLKTKSISELERQMEMRTLTPNVVEDESEDEEINTRRARRVGQAEVSSDSEVESATGKGQDDGGRSATEEDLTSPNGSDDEKPKPVGGPIGSSDHGELLYEAYQSNGKTYELEDAVMVFPEEGKIRPGVGIIKTIRQAADGEMFVTLRWLYRPEAIDSIKDDPRWLLYDPRELFFTDVTEEVSTVHIMYKCVVHFLSSQKQLPNRKVHPGFVVQHYYDSLKQKLFKIPQEADWSSSLQKEIRSHIRETELRMSSVPDIDNEDKAGCSKGNNERFLVENTADSTISKDTQSPDKQGLERPDERLLTQQCKIRTPKSLKKSSCSRILSLYGALREDNRRNIYLEKLLEAVHSQWGFIKSQHEVGGEFLGADLTWPDSVVRPIFSLEHDADIMYEGDIQKYNQKMRQLAFNLKKNGVLAKRFVTQELNSSILLNMSPEELKAGLTAEELPKNDSDDNPKIQMVNGHCIRCSKKKVSLLDIIQAGSKERYKVECTECGHIWFTSRNEIS